MSPELQASLIAILLGLIGWLLRQSYATKSEMAGILAAIRKDMGEGDKKLARMSDALVGFDGQGGILGEQRRQADRLGNLSDQFNKLALQTAPLVPPPVKPRRPR